MSIRDILHELYEQHGELTAELLVDVARNAAHPLHDQFEWDDAVAGEEHRKHQARRLIARVKVRYVDPRNDAHTVKARAYHSVRTPAGQAYRSTDDVVTDPYMRQLMRRQMYRDFQAMLDRYNGFDELWAMIKDALDKQQHPEIAA